MDLVRSPAMGPRGLDAKLRERRHQLRKKSRPVRKAYAKQVDNNALLGTSKKLDYVRSAWRGFGVAQYNGVFEIGIITLRVDQTKLETARYNLLYESRCAGGFAAARRPNDEHPAALRMQLSLRIARELDALAFDIVNLFSAWIRFLPLSTASLRELFGSEVGAAGIFRSLQESISSTRQAEEMPSRGAAALSPNRQAAIGPLHPLFPFPPAPKYRELRNTLIEGLKVASIVCDRRPSSKIK
jgi:hypothetical protein